ncbi:MAG TPA: hypothetical protein VJ739_14200 [Gemmataceae bacterium]|nr:hypothetical protein [Gemmataceae bacterium]
MISIDFGNSYTKVGIRPAADRPSQILTDASLSLDELNMCVPTLAARLRRSGRESWYFGNDVMQQEQDPGLTVYRNWKPLFFRGVETRLPRGREPAPAPVAAGGAGGLTNQQWEALQKQLGLPDEVRDAIDAAMRSRQKPSAGAAGKTEETDLDMKQVGLGFFRWLGEFVGPVCRKLGLGSLAEVPVRISLPSFGSATKAELLLREMLEEAGWRPDERAPALAEPLANAIGTFTEGVNATHRPGNCGLMPHYGKMFEHTGLLRAMREALLHGGPKVAWAMIVDLGGYTADFAMMGLDLEDIDARLDGEHDGKRRTSHYSEPIGVHTLDGRVRALLSGPRLEAFSELGQDPDQRRLETFHRAVYGKLRTYVLRRAVIGEGEEGQQIRECLAEFAEEVADYAEKFLETYQYTQISDLILTGGGTMIPTVRTALLRRLGGYGNPKVHAYFEPAEAPSRNSHRLGQKLVRGATALGGASVYFDFAQ